jgi:hypothetical protein
MGIKDSVNITGAGAPYFDDMKAYKDAAKKNADDLQGTRDLKKNLDAAMSKLKGYSSQVTPGDFKSKDNLKDFGDYPSDNTAGSSYDPTKWNN